MLGGIPVADHLSHAELMAAQRSGEVGSVHSWELVTAVDGPGTRMTTFVAGCPLRCLYCHNPDTMTAKRGVPVLADDLLAHLVAIAKGSVRRVSNNLGEIYRVGATEGWDGCDLARWGNRPLQQADVKRRGV